jgi:hypothetical protein
MTMDAGAEKSWLKDVLGTAFTPLTWLWQEAPYALPLVLLACLWVLRITGWHMKVWPTAKLTMDAMGKSTDLAACFPSEGAQARLRMLLGGEPSVRRWMQAAENTLARWFGHAIWGPEAAEKALQIAVVYPLLFLGVVWVFTGSATLGTATVLPKDVPGWQRGLLLFGLVTGSIVWWQLLRQARHRLVGRRRQFAEISLLFAAFSFAFAAAGAVAGPIAAAAAAAAAGAVAGSVAFAVAVAGTGAVAITVAFGGAGTVAVAGAGAVAVAVAGNVAGNVAATIAVAGAGAVFFLSLEQLKLKFTGGATRLCLYVASTALFATLCAWITPQYSSPRMLAADRGSYVVLFFMCILPIWNASLDVLSVGATRFFLRRYIATGRGWWWMVTLDIALAVLLTVLLFFGVIALLHGLQALGWGVDASATLKRFQADPTAPDVNWILGMALTNVVPTLLHLCLVFAGLMSGWLLRDAAMAHSLQAAPVVGSGLVTSSGALLPTAPPTLVALQLKTTLSPVQAQALVNWVYIDFWLAAAFPWCVAILLWPVWRALMSGVLRLLT